MKKIVIVGWTYSLNYGTLLQAYALDIYLRTNWEVEGICECYEFCGVGKILTMQNISDYIHSVIHPVKEKIRFILSNGCMNIKLRSELEEKLKIKESRVERFVFENFKYLKIENTMQLKKNVEKGSIFLVGSDQVWNPYYLHMSKLLNFVPQYYKKISYATSIGVRKLPKNKVSKYKHYLKKFDKISVRETAGKEALEDILTRRDIEVVLDPTFLLNRNEWKYFGKKSQTMFEKRRPYIFSYFVGEKEDYSEALEHIKNKLGMEIAYLSCNSTGLKLYGYNCADAGPHEFIDLLDNANIICTDSFHAVALSLNLNKDFVVFKRFREDDTGSQNSRIEELLDKFNLQDRLISSKNELDSIITHPIDFNISNVILEGEREKAYHFLHESIC